MGLTQRRKGAKGNDGHKMILHPLYPPPNPYLATSVKRVSRSTVTLISPG